MTAKQADCAFSKYKNEEIVGTELVYECDGNNAEKTDSKLYPYEGAMLNDFELCNVHAEIGEIKVVFSQLKSRLC